MKITNGKIQIFLAMLAIVVAIITPEIRSKILGAKEEARQKENKEFTEKVPNTLPKKSDQEVRKSQNANEQEVLRTQPLISPKQPGNLESKPKEENYTSFINTASKKSEVSVMILDASGNILNSVSSAIAKVYSKIGRIASIGLIRGSFVGRPQFRDLCEGNSEVIERLGLRSYTDYLAIGKINFALRPGKLVDGTIICNASISVTIISTQSKSITQSFTISNANGNGADESQAKENALQKLLNEYYNEYTSL